MTVLVAWNDENGGWLLADSAGSRPGQAKSNYSSFGELQNLDDRVVEETAIKIVQLPRAILAAVAGDSSAASLFLDMLKPRLEHTDKSLQEILDGLLYTSQRSPSFLVVFMCRGLTTHEALIFDSMRGCHVGTTGPTESWIAGSPSEGLRNQIVMGMACIRQLQAPPETRQIMAATYMQSLGIANVLPLQGIGGAFWTSRLEQGVCHWQDDIIYVIHDSDSFVSYAKDGGQNLNGVKSALFVRCLIRDGIGFTISPVRRQLFVTAPLGMKQEHLDIALRKIHEPRRYLSASRYVAFIHKNGRRIVLLDYGESVSAPHARDFSYVYDNDLNGIETTSNSPPSSVAVIVSDLLRQTLEEEPPPEHLDCQCFVTVVLYRSEQPNTRYFVIPHVKESDLIPGE